MSIEAMIAVRDRSDARNGERLVMLALADYANEYGLAWPSVATLTHWTRLGVRAVQGALTSLVDAGELKRHGQTKNGTVIYELTPGGEPVRSKALQAAPKKKPTPAESAGGANSAGVQNLRGGGAESAPNPLINPHTNNLSSNAGEGDEEIPVNGKTEPAKKPEKKTGYQGSLGVWAEAFFEKTGRAPIFPQVATAAKKAREVANALGPDLYLSAIDFFFSASADPWYSENGYPWQVFVSQANTLAKKAQEHGKYSTNDPVNGKSNRRAAPGAVQPTTAGTGPEGGSGSSSGGRSKYAQATD